MKLFVVSHFHFPLFSANQILQLVDSFIHDDPNWLLFTTDISFDNLVVTQDENQVCFSSNSYLHFFSF